MSHFQLALLGSRDSSPEGVAALKEHLQSRLGLSAEGVSAIFLRLPVVVRRHLDAEKAQALKTALEKLGALIELRPELESPVPPVHKPIEPAELPTSSSNYPTSFQYAEPEIDSSEEESSVTMLDLSASEEPKSGLMQSPEPAQQGTAATAPSPESATGLVFELEEAPVDGIQKTNMGFEFTNNEVETVSIPPRVQIPTSPVHSPELHKDNVHAEGDLDVEEEITVEPASIAPLIHEPETAIPPPHVLEPPPSLPSHSIANALVAVPPEHQMSEQEAERAFFAALAEAESSRRWKLPPRAWYGVLGALLVLVMGMFDPFELGSLLSSPNDKGKIDITKEQVESLLAAQGQFRPTGSKGVQTVKNQGPPRWENSADMDNGSVLIKLGVTNNKVNSVYFEFRGREAPIVPLDQVARGVERLPWISQVVADTLRVTHEGDRFVAQGGGRTYIASQKGSRRLPAEVIVRGIFDPAAPSATVTWELIRNVPETERKAPWLFEAQGGNISFFGTGTFTISPENIPPAVSPP